MADAMNKIKMALENLQRASSVALYKVDGLTAIESDFKTSNTPPDGEYKPFTTCSKKYCHYWIKGEFDTPAAEPDTEYCLRVDTGLSGWDALNPQALLFLNGKIVQGIDLNHKENAIEPSTHYDMLSYWYTAEREHFGISYTVAKIYTKVEKLYYDLLVPFEACSKVYDAHSAEYHKTLALLEMAINILDLRSIHSKEFFASVDRAIDFFENEYYKKLCSSEGKPEVICLGHTHIDVEWRWSRYVTKEKIQCSFSTAKALMDKYPEYKFMLSQPNLYQYLKDEAPEKYEELKELVREGRWEPEGSMYVECDCNLTSGESLVRQLLYGKKFFKDEFGKESKVLFLPDVFGYSAAMPQILKKSGVDYFVTSKISWNDTNTVPHDTFIWQGIDGTEIFTTFISGQRYHKGKAPDRGTTYVGNCDPDFVYGTWHRQTDKGYVSSSFNTYGYGDGGGGPTKDMLEKLKRLMRGLPAFPVAKSEFLLPYLKDLEAEFLDSTEKLRKVPKWIGELYLEFHRGTYTTMANNKRGNRRSEFGLAKVEALSYTDMLFGGSYDKAQLDKKWIEVLHDQFHDILPGSSIEEVYIDSAKDYERILSFIAAESESKLKSISSKLNTDGGIFVYNALGFPRRAKIKVDGKCYITDEMIPALGWKVVKPISHASALIAESRRLENEFYTLTFDDAGRISSLYDKRVSRNVLSAPANEIRLYEDFPHEYDAWELEHDYATKTYIQDSPASSEIIHDGDRVGIRFSRSYMNSEFTQTVWIYSGSPRIDIENDFDWHEKHQIMKLAFPFDVHSSSATFEIQYGHTERPTHRNTSWDQAKFEVCAHKWVDISESGYGIAVLNDSKYGFSADEGTITVSCLRGPTFPNKNADMGKHSFTISLIPHTGDIKDGRVIEEAYSLNQPADFIEICKCSGTLPEEYSLVSCDSDSVIVEGIKRAEDSDDLIVRLYEAYNAHSSATLTLGEKFSKAYLCDLMENPIKEIAITNNSVTLPMNNFEIETIRFVK
ncbi:MAG: alpha-mannosidase [Clostridia bacterium]|nr:alpha-mannosidase [Clostridia bacterium]